MSPDVEEESYLHQIPVQDPVHTLRYIQLLLQLDLIYQSHPTHYEV